MKEQEHPLITAIRLKKKAIRNKAHPKVIANLERIIAERSKKSMDIMRKSAFVSDILDGKVEVVNKKIVYKDKE